MERLYSGGEEQQSLRRRDLGFEPFDRRRLRGIVILVVEGKSNEDEAIVVGDAGEFFTYGYCPG